MKKYIAPAVELKNVASHNIIATSFVLSDKETSEQLSRDIDWNIWGDGDVED